MHKWIGSRKLANSIGDNLPIYPVKGYSITINNPGNNSPWVSLLDDDDVLVQEGPTMGSFIPTWRPSHQAWK